MEDECLCVLLRSNYLGKEQMQHVVWSKQLCSKSYQEGVQFTTEKDGGISLLTLSLSDDYNHEMNNNDISDQLCLIYLNTK
eukprot:10148561-Ditylum_brightwellii.AAC.1